MVEMAGFEKLGGCVLGPLSCFATDGRIGFFEKRFEELVSS